MSTCSCENACKPNITNAVGVEIQEFALPAGWVGNGPIYPTFCEARKVMSQFPPGNAERRIYPALGPAVKRKK